MSERSGSVRLPPPVTRWRAVAAGVATAVAAVLAGAVTTGWLTAPVAGLLAWAAAVLAMLGLVGLRMRRLGTGLADLHGLAGESRARLVEATGRLEQLDATVTTLERAAHLREQLPDQSVAPFTAAFDDAGARLRTQLYSDIYQQLEAHSNLLSLVTPRAPMPSLGGWALNADVLHTVAGILWRHRPALIVECGSGSSSIWLGYLAERLGSGRVVALEHDGQYLADTIELVRQHDLERAVEIRHAPLEPWRAADGTHYPWYAQASLSGLDGIGLLLVDGPPAATGPNARYPAGPLLISRCADGAVIVLDDTIRADERSISDQWVAEWPGLRRTTHCRGWAHVLRFSGSR